MYPKSVFHVLILSWSQHQWLREKRGFLANQTSATGSGALSTFAVCTWYHLCFSFLATVAGFRRLSMADGDQPNAMSAEMKKLHPIEYFGALCHHVIPTDVLTRRIHVCWTQLVAADSTDSIANRRLAS